jgi:hypothetical protein
MDMTGAVVHSSETIIRKKKKKAKNEKIQSEEVRLQMRVFLLFGTCTEDAVDFYFNVEDEAQTKSQSMHASSSCIEDVEDLRVCMHLIRNSFNYTSVCVYCSCFCHDEAKVENITL